MEASQAPAAVCCSLKPPSRRLGGRAWLVLQVQPEAHGGIPAHRRQSRSSGSLQGSCWWEVQAHDSDRDLASRHEEGCGVPRTGPGSRLPPRSVTFRVDSAYAKSHERREADIGSGSKGAGRHGPGTEPHARCLLIPPGMFVCLCGPWVRACWPCPRVVGAGSAQAAPSELPHTQVCCLGGPVCSGSQPSSQSPVGCAAEASGSAGRGVAWAT